MAKTNRVLPRQLTGNSKQLFFNTTKLVSTHGYHQMFNTEISSIMFFASKHGEALYRQKKKRPGADYGSDNKLLVANFRLTLKKVY